LMGSNGGWMVIFPLAVWLLAKIIIFKRHIDHHKSSVNGPISIAMLNNSEGKWDLCSGLFMVLQLLFKGWLVMI
jgi:hypothetical protein